MKADNKTTIKNQLKTDVEVSINQPNGIIEITKNGTHDVKKFKTAKVDVEGIIPTGTLEVTENGMYDVIEKANVNVNVEQGVFPTGTLEITENGEYDVTEKASVNVNIAESGGAVEVLPVSNVVISEDNILSFNVPDFSSFKNVDHTILYVITINDFSFETSDNIIDLNDYLLNGVNTISIYVKIITSSEIVVVSASVVINIVITQLSSLPESLSSCNYGQVGQYIYLMGGKGVNAISKSGILKFDTTTETFTTLETTLPVPLYGSGCSVAGNSIYIFGGSSSAKTIYEFDTTTETFTTLSGSSPSTDGISCSLVGDYIYLVCCGQRNVVCKFDTKNKTITTLSVTPPIKINYVQCHTIGNSIYIFGGNLNGPKSNAILEFDTTTETFTTLETTLPTTLGNSNGAIINNNVYIIGGYTASNVPTNTIYRFNPKTKITEVLETTLPASIANFAVGSYNNTIYIFGGETKYNNGGVNTIYKININ